MIEPATQTWSENNCGVHYAHTLCVRKHSTNHECAVCDPSLATAKKAQEEEVVVEEEGEAPKIALPSTGIFSSITRLTSKLSRDDVETSTDPFFLVRSRYPADLFLKKKKMRLHHLVNEHGISIDDFARAKYTFKDLLKFPEIDRDDGFDTLIGMGLNRNNLYAYKEQLPFQELRKRYQVTSQDIIDRLGYKFADGWSSAYLIECGFTMDQLMASGLKYETQFADLNLKPEEARAMGVTDRHLLALKPENKEGKGTRSKGVTKHYPPSTIRFDDTCIGHDFEPPVTPKKVAVVHPVQSEEIRPKTTKKDASGPALVFPVDKLRKKRSGRN